MPLAKPTVKGMEATLCLRTKTAATMLANRLCTASANSSCGPLCTSSLPPMMNSRGRQIFSPNFVGLVSLDDKLAKYHSGHFSRSNCKAYCKQVISRRLMRTRFRANPLTFSKIKVLGLLVWMWSTTAKKTRAFGSWKGFRKLLRRPEKGQRGNPHTYKSQSTGTACVLP